ncbi:MAG: AlkZ family DNA glycosylase [Chitinophagaceae bacterium]|nr:AlkZ family DNA glycosylase [Chitinophagaceae bacterium]
MTAKEIIAYRLARQHIIFKPEIRPEGLVERMIAMQAQEYAMAKWAIGLRLQTGRESEVEKAFNRGDILRTHLMRPTWHFVSPADIRWLLKLTAPRVHGINGFMNRKMELDSATFSKTDAIISKALEGGKHLTRIEIQEILKRNKILASGPRLGCIMMKAELDAIICSGARKGKQFSYALLDERVPSVKVLSKDEALAGFATRYFRTRGPASIHDFAYWSGLTLTDAKKGAATLPPGFASTLFNGREYYYEKGEHTGKFPGTFLMPDYDEYGMSYKDRSIILGPHYKGSDSTVYSHWLVINGVIEGTWDKKIKGNKLTAIAKPFTKLTAAKQKLVNAAVMRYNEFSSA